MGSHVDSHLCRARQVGEWVARQGYHLLTGAGEGVMGAVTRAFVEVADRQGSALGVVPCLSEDPRCTPVSGYPNPWVEIPIYTHLDRGGPDGDELTSRNHVNVLTSSALILLPGGEGTASEARLALKYKRPLIAYLKSRDEIPGLLAEIPVESDWSLVTAFVSASVED